MIPDRETVFETFETKDRSAGPFKSFELLPLGVPLSSASPLSHRAHPFLMGRPVDHQCLPVGLGAHFGAVHNCVPKNCWWFVAMHIDVVRNHRRCYVDATLGRYVEVMGSKMNDHPIALDFMTSVIRFQMRVRPFVSFEGDWEAFIRTEFALVASHKKNGLPRVFKQSE